MSPKPVNPKKVRKRTRLRQNPEELKARRAEFRRSLVLFGKDLLVGLPALAVGILLFSTIKLTSTERAAADRLTAFRYEAEGQRRIKLGDIPTAQVCYRRLVSLSTNRPEFHYMLVLLYERTGELEHALPIAQSLASAAGGNYHLAHLWLAKYLLNKPKPSREEVRGAESHLVECVRKASQPDHTLRDEPWVKESKTILGHLYFKTGRPALARNLLVQVAGNQPMVLIEIGRACKALGNEDDVRHYADLAKRYAEADLEKSTPETEISPRMLMASASTLRGDFSKAIEVLREGASKKNDPAYAKAIAIVYAAQAPSLAKAGREKNPELLQHLAEGLQFDPSNEPLLIQLSKLLEAGGPEAEESKALLEGMLIKGKAPALAHLALGNHAWTKLEKERARLHWEQAFKLNPRLMTVANNLAYILAHNDPADPAAALTMIESVLSRAPNVPYFHSTRGEILVRLDRWKEAVTELETGLAGGDKDPEVHAVLAVAYDRLGLADLAAKHREAVPPAKPVANPEPR